MRELASSSSREDVPFLPLLVGLAAWPLYRIVVDRIVRWCSPDFYKGLRIDYEKRYLFFFGILLGLLVKPIPLISCGLAVWKTPPEDDIAGVRPPANTHQQVCWGSRTVVYISELPHYLHIPEMVFHHLLVLLCMFLVAKYHVPRRGLDLNLAALWSEVPYSFRNVLKWTGYLDSRPNLDRRLIFYGTIFLFVTRAPTTIISIAMIPSTGMGPGPALVTASAYLFHLAYITRITLIRLKKSGTLQIEKSGVFRVRAGNRLHTYIDSTSILTGIAFLSTQISLVFLYACSIGKTEPRPATTTELVNIMWNSLLSGFIGLAGSSLVTPFVKRTLQWRQRSPICLHVQCSFVIAASVLCLSPTLEISIDKETLVSCLLLTSSLTKAVAQYASHLACLHPTAPASPVQHITRRTSLACSSMNLCQYLVLVFSVVNGYSSVSSAAFKTFVIQLLVRTAVDSTLTKGITGLGLGSLAALTTLWRFGLMKTTDSAYQFGHDTGNRTVDLIPTRHMLSSVPLRWRVAIKFMLLESIEVGGLYLLFSTTTAYFWNLSQTRPQRFNLPRLRTLGLVIFLGWISYVVYLVSTGQSPGEENRDFTAAEILAREPPVCSLLLSWHFWTSVTAAVVIPTAAAHLCRHSLTSEREDPVWARFANAK